MTEDKGIPIRNIYWMLSYAWHELRQDNYRSLSSEAFEDVRDLLAAILSRGIDQRVKQGVTRGYVVRRESLSSLRGSLDMAETARNRCSRRLLLGCEYEELGEDCPENRIIKAVMRLLIREPSVRAETKRALRVQLAFFERVSDIRPEEARRAVVRLPRSGGGRILVNLCGLILKDLLMTTEDGACRLAEFSESDMARLYERFILEYYIRHHPELHPASASLRWNVDPGADTSLLPGMQTDVMLKKGGRTLIIDAKYYARTLIENRFGRPSLRSAHLYQIYAYVKNADVENDGSVSGLLLYARSRADGAVEMPLVKFGGNLIGARTLDLSRPFEEIASRLEDVAALL